MTNHTLSIAPATKDDLPALLRLHSRCGSPPSSRQRKQLLKKCLLDQSLLLAKRGSEPLAAAALDIHKARLADWLFTPGRNGPTGAARLFAEAERLAVRFGILELKTRPLRGSQAFFEAGGYRPESKTRKQKSIEYSKSLRRRQTRYNRKVYAIHQVLGIPGHYGREHLMPLQPESRQLSSIGNDIYGREQKLHPRAAKAWNEMKYAAFNSGIEIQAVSAWRSVVYQQALLQRKLDKGQKIEEILRVSAAPGFSEHHTGRAIDITTPGPAVLEEEFEDSHAFKWLKKNAPDYGFYLSFPRNNRHKLAYEPWHWCFKM